jgi:hypothetical protein
MIHTFYDRAYSAFVKGKDILPHLLARISHRFQSLGEQSM